MVIARFKRRIGHGVSPIARTSSHIAYRPDQPTLALIDFDTKGMPHPVQASMDQFGGFLPALMSVVPELAAAGRVVRPSTSSGITRTDTGQAMVGSNGMHLFVQVQDGADVERFLKALHARCWLRGFGWMMVGAAGQLLERSLVDRMVYAPERLVFEAAPILEPPLAQDQASRQPTVMNGEALDTIAACPPLTIVEQASLRELLTKERHRLAPESAKVRSNFVLQQSSKIAESTGISRQHAMRIADRQCRGVLLPHVLLPFDDPELVGFSVADVLADPAWFEGVTLADPLEGIEYGRCKARVMRRADGSPWIHSFAHGRTVYDLSRDFSYAGGASGLRI